MLLKPGYDIGNRIMLLCVPQILLQYADHSRGNLIAAPANLILDFMTREFGALNLYCTSTQRLRSSSLYTPSMVVITPTGREALLQTIPSLEDRPRWAPVARYKQKSISSCEKLACSLLSSTRTPMSPMFESAATLKSPLTSPSPCRYVNLCAPVVLPCWLGPMCTPRNLAGESVTDVGEKALIHGDEPAHLGVEAGLRVDHKSFEPLETVSRITRHKPKSIAFGMFNPK